MTDHELSISSFRDLSPLYTAYTMEDDEDGNPIYMYSSFGFFTTEYAAYFGKSSSKPSTLTIEELKACLKPLPDDDVYPELPMSGITIFSGLVDDPKLFLKAPKVHEDFIGTGLLPKLMLQEAETLELLLRTPHPNIARYHGCLAKRGRIVRLVFDRYDMTLKQRLDREEISRHLNIDNLMKQIESALHHLHILGLAHNDLNPMNIMINDSNETLYLIDFGSCRPFGASLITGGTPGWFDEDYSISAKENDEIALEKLRSWLYTMKEQQSLE
ncbi:uncharacterized protein RCC_08061 [Ramularia collo-cygni]|uniref:Protein kinase domain-containing protein n=1 Tax=Ramularia collo-cygni TaxID=112498 RepID=A0A2D3UWJ5_9PEZI|nr:uncharacterized protein RCC_08061 [Ramularia collo-cygni]CZT22192.1 uncharacterized protein RCC_08061 [Ramularia collo-cygni]